MANSADPDQTAPSVWSGSALFAQNYAFLSGTLVQDMLGHLSYTQNTKQKLKHLLFSTCSKVHVLLKSDIS